MANQGKAADIYRMPDIPRTRYARERKQTYPHPTDFDQTWPSVWRNIMSWNDMKLKFLEQFKMIALDVAWLSTASKVSYLPSY